jgi:hypothetical protein
MWKSAGRAPPKNASFTLQFALQLRKNHGNTSVRVWKTSVRLRKPQLLQNPHTHTHTHTPTHTHTHPHTLQNNIKPPQYSGGFILLLYCYIYTMRRIPVFIHTDHIFNDANPTNIYNRKTSPTLYTIARCNIQALCEMLRSVRLNINRWHDRYHCNDNISTKPKFKLYIFKGEV